MLPQFDRDVFDISPDKIAEVDHLHIGAIHKVRTHLGGGGGSAKRVRTKGCSMITMMS